ncbi:MAG: TAXI family TRAP transporter solute-binding subunit [Chloroflexota bacterium]
MKNKQLTLIISTVIVVLIIIGIVAYFFLRPLPPTELTLSTGREGGAYYAFGLMYQSALAKEGYTLAMQPGAGSIETLERLSRGDVEVGFVQGGTAEAGQVEGLSSLGSLFYEPIWLFYNQANDIEYLSDLEGLAVAVGEEGSGTRPVAVQLLQDNNLTAENTSILALSSQEATDQLIAGEIDAAFFIMSPKAERVQALLRQSNIRLLSFRRHLAYSGRHPFLTQVVLGEGAIDLADNIPEEDKTLLATTATLVVRDDIHPAHIRLLLKEADTIHREPGLLESFGQFPSELLVELPMNEDARRYLNEGAPWLERIFPFSLAVVLDRLIILLVSSLPLLFFTFRIF